MRRHGEEMGEQERLERYAKLVLQVGNNLQPGQDLLITWDPS